LQGIGISWHWLLFWRRVAKAEVASRGMKSLRFRVALLDGGGTLSLQSDSKDDLERPLEASFSGVIPCTMDDELTSFDKQSHGTTMDGSFDPIGLASWKPKSFG
jgi:hypothetical protein